jgi:D-alanyl-D-alanine carboxypeptidase
LIASNEDVPARPTVVFKPAPVRLATALPELPEPLPTADPRLPTQPRQLPTDRFERVAAAAPAPARPPVATAKLGSADPIKPIPVKTIAISRAPEPVRMAQPAEVGTQYASAVPTRGLDLAPPNRRSFAREEESPAEARTAHAQNGKGDWIIQIGAFPAESQAKDRLKSAQHVAPSILNGAEPFTERVVKRDATLYRARFAGFERDEAEAACRHLKQSDISCLALKN